MSTPTHKKQIEMQLRNGIYSVLNYFELFQYAPDFHLLYVFLPVKALKGQVKGVLEKEVSKGSIKKFQHMHTGIPIFARTDSIVQNTTTARRYRWSLEKEKGVAVWFAIMRVMPWVYGIGISGSCATYNAKEGDDVDVLVISAPGGMWFCRLTAVLAAKLIGQHRGRSSQSISGRLCLNMFLDCSDLQVPIHKQNLYTAHEVVQMRPVFMRAGVYEMYLKANMWIRVYAPNARIPTSKASRKRTTRSQRVQSYLVWSFIMKPFELAAKKFQLAFMSPKRGEEYITNTQLWFFPHDYTRKIEKKIDIR